MGIHGDPRQLEKLALLDSLTELYNHDTINRMLKDEVQRALRYKRELSLYCHYSLDCLTHLHPNIATRLFATLFMKKTNSVI